MIRITTLGAVSMSTDIGEGAEASATKQKIALLSFLAIEGPVARDRILGVFWPDREEEKARHARLASRAFAKVVEALETGRPREAEPYLKSLDYDWVFAPHIGLYLGRLYEALGNRDEARLHYARFVRAWEDCDPELRPMWEEGRQALARLTREGEP